MKIKADKALSPFFLEGWSISKDTWFDIEYVDARQFLKPERIDLVSKLMYIDCRERNVDNTYAKKIYSEYIKAFSLGTYTEPGNENKNSLEKYFYSFDKLIDSIHHDGLLADKSVVPVGENNSILDGSHRTAIAIYYGMKLPIIRIHNIEKNYNYEFFKDRGMDEVYLEQTVMKYIEFSEQCYVACLWPRGKGNQERQKAEELLRREASIVYKKEIRFNYNGITQLMVHIYGNQKWAGNLENGFAGIYNKSKECYDYRNSTVIYILQGCDLQKIIKLKEQIRGIFGVENHSIHITDTKQEAIDASKMLLNHNSVELMNYGDIIKPTKIIKKILDEYDNQSCKIISQDVTKILFGILNESEEHSIWNNSENFFDPYKYGYVYGIKFLGLENCELTVYEKMKYFIKKIRYGAIANCIKRINIKRRIRHLGGVILRKIKIIR